MGRKDHFGASNALYYAGHASLASSVPFYILEKRLSTPRGQFCHPFLLYHCTCIIRCVTYLKYILKILYSRTQINLNIKQTNNTRKVEMKNFASYYYVVLCTLTAKRLYKMIYWDGKALNSHDKCITDKILGCPHCVHRICLCFGADCICYKFFCEWSLSM